MIETLSKWENLFLMNLNFGKPTHENAIMKEFK